MGWTECKVRLVDSRPIVLAPQSSFEAGCRVLDRDGIGLWQVVENLATDMMAP
jgi:hypothetical protein